jgi:hypothetical protein
MSSASSADSDAGKPQGHPSYPSDSWLMKTTTSPIDPLVFELRQIQNTALAILRKTDFAKDYEAAPPSRPKGREGKANLVPGDGVYYLFSVTCNDSVGPGACRAAAAGFFPGG